MHPGLQKADVILNIPALAPHIGSHDYPRDVLGGLTQPLLLTAASGVESQVWMYKPARVSG